MIGHDIVIRKMTDRCQGTKNKTLYSCGIEGAKRIPIILLDQHYILNVESHIKKERFLKKLGEDFCLSDNYAKPSWMLRKLFQYNKLKLMSFS